jgi:hypothetical protein
MSGSARLERCLEQNVSLVLGSVDAQGQPCTCRALALGSSDGLSTVTVYVPVHTSRETIANVASTRRLTIVATHPIDHNSLQLKGTAGAARLARDEEREFVNRGFDGFAELLHTIGIPRRITNAVTRWPAYAIDMKVEEIYDQTPGPKAGTRMK